MSALHINIRWQHTCRCSCCLLHGIDAGPMLEAHGSHGIAAGQQGCSLTHQHRNCLCNICKCLMGVATYYRAL